MPATRTLHVDAQPHPVSTHRDNLSTILGPFSSDHDAEKLEALVDRLRQSDFTLPAVSHQIQPTCCELYSIDRELQSLDEGVQDQLCSYIGNDIDDNHLEHYNINNPENGSQYKTRPKPRQYFCDRHNLNKARKNILFFNHRKPAEITPDDHSAMGVWRRSVKRAQANNKVQ